MSSFQVLKIRFTKVAATSSFLMWQQIFFFPSVKWSQAWGGGMFWAIGPYWAIPGTPFSATFPTERVTWGHFQERVDESPRKGDDFGTSGYLKSFFVSSTSYFHQYNYSFCSIDLTKSRYTWTLTAVRPQKVLSSWNGGRHGGGHSGRRQKYCLVLFCTLNTESLTVNPNLKKIEKEAAGIYEMAKINTKDPAQSYILAC